MPGYLIDTQTITYWFHGESGNYPAVQAAAEERIGDHPLYVSAVTLGEIEYGHATNPGGVGQPRDEFVRFVREALPQVLPVSRHTAEPYGQIRGALFERFAPKSKKTKTKRAEEMCDPTTGRELGIDENDLWIVAQAAERNLVLVTNDKKFLKRAQDVGLEVAESLGARALAFENWAERTP